LTASDTCVLRTIRCVIPNERFGVVFPAGRFWVGIYGAASCGDRRTRRKRQIW
jgi:hypothetical protein